MILGKSAAIHSVSHLFGVLTRCQKAVVRVKLGESVTFCTGFFILPDLVVAPAFAFEARPADDVVVEAFRAGERLWQRKQKRSAVEFVAPGADVHPQQWTEGQGALLALIRVQVPAKRRSTKGEREADVLQLGFEAPEPGQFVAVVQFARGGSQHGISFGRVESCTDAILRYDADTEGGSSGSPILNRDWSVVGMHFASSHSRKTNEGITRAGLVGALRHSTAWPEIQEHHRIADVAAAKEHVVVTSAPADQPQAEPLLVRAALSSSLNRSSLNEKEQETLRPFVAEPDAAKWVLRPGERSRAIRAAGSLAALRKSAPKPAGPNDDVLQRVIDRILKGPPYDLHEEDDASLAWWIQASRWFAGIDDAIPSPAEVARVLERKRTRSRLQLVAGADFRGRKTELEKLNRWWTESKQPLSLTGIGGIGKSALIARFASQLPSSTLLLWLDFDRADLAPDDAASVLSILAQQAAAQVDDLEVPAIDIEKWATSANELGARIDRALPRDAAVLLVLDSFEAAQYRERYQELWPVLEAIAAALPRMRLAVTGRAPVPNLRLCGEDAMSIHLRGLQRHDAAEWLREQDVTDEQVLERVLDLADGVPLILRLALRFLERGGKAEDLPEKLPPAIVAGFLYDRILDRVQNPLLKPLAMAALVTRRVTSDMIQPVFAGIVELPQDDISKWFPDLAREMALVEGTDVLKIRSEVRTPALELLEKDQPALVKSVDERAVEWYRKENKSDPELVAELIYHALRLGDVATAEKAWRDDCRKFLRDVGDDMPAGGRAWLHARGVGVIDESAIDPTAAWEADAAERIRAARARGNERAVKHILHEREERTTASPLLFHDAYEMWLTGYRTKALELLEEAGEVAGPVGRDRTVLRALLFAEAGDDRAAKTLASVEGPEQWADRPQPGLHAVAVRAARIRLTVDLDAECSLLTGKSALGSQDSLPAAAILPLLRRALMGDYASLESVSAVTEVDVRDVTAVAALVKRVRERTERRDVSFLPSPLLEALARQRWALATPGFLAAAYEQIVAAEDIALARAVRGTLAMFAPVLQVGRDESFILTGSDGPLFDVIAIRNPGRRMPKRFGQWEKRVLRALHEGVDPDVDWESDIVVSGQPGNDAVSFRREIKSLPPDQRAVVALLFSPNPLEQLVHELAGHSG